MEEEGGRMEEGGKMEEEGGRWRRRGEDGGGGREDGGGGEKEEGGKGRYYVLEGLLSARRWRHQRVVFPAVETHGSRVVCCLGDQAGSGFPRCGAARWSGTSPAGH